MRTSPRGKIPNRSQGFTLVEMSVVITLVALFATMVIPSIAHWREGIPYRQFPGKLMQMIVQVREDSIRSGGARSLTYDDSVAEFSVRWIDPDTSQEQQGARLALPDRMELSRLIVDEADVAPSAWSLTFYADGSADRAGIELQDDDRSLSVTVSEAGYARLRRAPLPEVDQDRWPAGENETRQ